MKKIAIALACTFAIGITLTSCKKDYNCSCRINIPSDSSGGITIEGIDSTYVVTYPDSKKKDAQTSCDNLETQGNTTAKLLNGSVTCDLAKK